MPERNECVKRGQYLVCIVRMTHLANKKQKITHKKTKQPIHRFSQFSLYRLVVKWKRKNDGMKWNKRSNWVKDYDERWLKVNEDAVANTKPKRTQ